MDKEILQLFNSVSEFVEWNASFINNNIQFMNSKDLDKSIKYENNIDNLRNILLDSSRDRLSNSSDSKVELLFMDLIKHLEHIGDYSLNISQALEQID